MADNELLHDNAVLSAEPCEDADPIIKLSETANLEFTLDNPTPLVDTDTDLLGLNSEESTETEVLSPVSGIEEITPEATEHDEAIVDGFPEQSAKQHAMNGTATPSVSAPATTTTDEGFEEITTPIIEDMSIPEKKDDSLKSPLALWMMKQNLHPQVISLLYWVELQRTTGVFGGIIFLLLSLRFYSVIGVITTFALSLLVVAFLYRIGMTIVKAVQKTSAEHPFKHLLEEKIELSEEATQKLASDLRVCINEKIRQAQCLFLVKDTVASLKAMVMFWLVSYIAGCVNFITLCILGTLVVFTVPKLYEEKQAEIDQLFSLVKTKTCMVCGIIEEKLPEKIKVYLKKDKKE